MSRIRANTITNQNANGAPNFPDGITVSGVVTSTTLNANITGNLSVTGNIGVGGTLTYEDVTNIDSVGLITARSGIRISAGSTVGPVSGIITYFGDGSQLTGISVDPSTAASSAGFLKVLNASTPQIRLNNDASDGATTRAFFGIASGSNNYITGSVANDTVLSARVSGDLLIGCGSTIRMRVSENGYVSMPAQPVFIGEGTNYTQSSSDFSDVIPNTNILIRGITRSGANLTVPEAGIYFFSLSYLFHPNSESSYHTSKILVNGSQRGQVVQGGGNQTGHGDNNFTLTMSLSANDVVKFQFKTGTGKVYSGQSNWMLFKVA